MSKEDTERVAFLRVPSDIREEEVEQLKSDMEATIPDKWGLVLYTDDLGFEDVDKFQQVLEDTLAQLKGNHRLSGAEPADQPADPPWEDNGQ